MVRNLSDVQSGIDEQEPENRGQSEKSVKEQVLLEEHGVNHAGLDQAIP